MSNLVVKPTITEKKAKDFLELLVQGRLESEAREVVVYPNGGIQILLSVAVFSPVVAMLHGLFLLRPYFELELGFSETTHGFMALFTTLSLGFVWILKVSEWIIKKYNKKYSRENLLACLSEEEKSLALHYIDYNEKAFALRHEYSLSEANFIIKYFGECNEKVLEEIRQVKEADPLKIVDLVNPGSEEYKKIKPPLKIIHKV